MKCPHCDSKIKKQDLFCSSCGKELDGSSATGESDSLTLASLDARFVALIIDGIIIGALVGLLVNMVEFSHYVTIPISEGSKYEILSNSPLYFLVVVLYYGLMESSPKQATLGKLIANIKVTDLNGRRLTLEKSLGRAAARLISVAVPLCYLAACITERKQGIHDLLADTVVVNK